MKKRYSLTKFFFILLNFLLIFFNAMHAEKAIVIVPVADVAGESLQSYYTHQPAPTSYTALPWAFYKKDHAACPRLHQLLYHEVVDVIDTDSNQHEIQVAIPNIFYQTMLNPLYQNNCWILKKNIVLFSELQKHGVDLEKLPPSIDYTKNNESAYCNTVTLIAPFTDQQSGLTFSAGTRFTKTSDQPYKDKVMVYYLHPKRHIQTLVLPIASTYAFHPKTMGDRIDDFLAILRKWAHQKNGIIPYVWGGCNFTSTCAENMFTLEYKRIHGKKLGYYMRSTTNTPKSGFDCSGLIMRAAQIVGLPYYCKNTYTITKQLPALKPDEHLKAGDLIWIYGHVLIVADVKKNTVIEAAAYDYGYGEVHELPIGSIFKGVTTFADLQKKYHEKGSVERLDRNGTVLDTYKEVKLFKLASQWV